MNPTLKRPIEKPHVSNCRWATPTLFLPTPFWFDAEECPWSCLADAAPRVLTATDGCARCARWEAQDVAPAMRGERMTAGADEQERLLVGGR